MRPPSNRVVELKIPSELGYEKIAREAVAMVARRLDFGEDKIDDIKTAISEACTNAIRYGSGGDSRMKVVVVLTADDTKLDILIKDPGISGDPPAGISIPDITGMVEETERMGGMGLFLIRNLVDEAGFVEVDEEDDDEGNQFRMVIYRIQDDDEE
ncbi:ATP-binding protein [Anaerolineales bacterium HSG6]|nr:ATP-binding protein [Anaerolineales bacterium HSG6]MDM8530879.1 ATP-binding protein [Anaerolineales bacterium HSG25]